MNYLTLTSDKITVEKFSTFRLNSISIRFYPDIVKGLCDSLLFGFHECNRHVHDLHNKT